MRGLPRFLVVDFNEMIGERGILDRSLGIGWIRWDEIDGAYQRRQHDQDSLYIKLRSGARSLMRLKRRRESEGSGDLRLDLRGTSLSAVELLQEILARSRVDPPGGTRVLRDA